MASARKLTGCFEPLQPTAMSWAPMKRRLSRRVMIDDRSGVTFVSVHTKDVVQVYVAHRRTLEGPESEDTATQRRRRQLPSLQGNEGFVAVLVVGWGGCFFKN
eukprot:m.428076 g.428076  ORF g.428076 m.428076 type:complete len:103 (-) comp20231_c1_seq3:50-358(-)